MKKEIISLCVVVMGMSCVLDVQAQGREYTTEDVKELIALVNKGDVDVQNNLGYNCKKERCNKRSCRGGKEVSKSDESG